MKLQPINRPLTKTRLSLQTSLLMPFFMLLLIVTTLTISACGNNSTQKATDKQGVQEKQTSTTQVSTDTQPANATHQPKITANKGKALFDGVCSSCHLSGVLDAPVIGDKSAWQARIAKGDKVLYMGVINGIGDMPVRGGAMDASDDEIKEAVEYMIQQSQ